MRPFSTEKIKSMEEVFYAVMGGIPDSYSEIKDFMANSPLRQLIFATDIERIILHDGFFADEAVDAVYALLPEKIPLSGTRKWLMSPQAFRALNQAKHAAPCGILINIPFLRADKIYREHIDEKMSRLLPLLHLAHQKQAEANNQKQKKTDLKMEDCPPEEQKLRRIENRIRNRKYREVHRVEIRNKQKERRARIKAENPELLKQLDKKANSKANRKEVCRRYYEKHKEDISRKNSQNPKSKIYKQRYKLKKKLEKTAPVLRQILSGLLVAKSL